MNLKSQLLKENSKSNCELIRTWVGDSQKKFDELFEHFVSGDFLLAQRAGWPLSYLVQDQPEFLTKHFARLLANLRKSGSHESVRRNSIRMLQDVQIPEKFEGQIMDACFGYIADPAEKPAVKAFALGVLGNLLRKYPEIGPELKTIIDDRNDSETAAFRSRAKKILKRLA